MKAYEAKYHCSCNLRTAVRGRSDLAAVDDRWTGKPGRFEIVDCRCRSGAGGGNPRRDQLPALAEKVFKAEEAD